MCDKRSSSSTGSFRSAGPEVHDRRGGRKLFSDIVDAPPPQEVYKGRSIGGSRLSPRSHRHSSSLLSPPPSTITDADACRSYANSGQLLERKSGSESAWSRQHDDDHHDVTTKYQYPNDEGHQDQQEQEGLRLHRRKKSRDIIARKRKQPDHRGTATNYYGDEEESKNTLKNIEDSVPRAVALSNKGSHNVNNMGHDGEGDDMIHPTTKKGSSGDDDVEVEEENDSQHLSSSLYGEAAAKEYANTRTDCGKHSRQMIKDLRSQSSEGDKATARNLPISKARNDENENDEDEKTYQQNQTTSYSKKHHHRNLPSSSSLLTSSTTGGTASSVVPSRNSSVAVAGQMNNADQEENIKTSSASHYAISREQRVALQPPPPRPPLSADFFQAKRFSQITTDANAVSATRLSSSITAMRSVAADRTNYIHTSEKEGSSSHYHYSSQPPMPSEEFLKKRSQHQGAKFYLPPAPVPPSVSNAAAAAAASVAATKRNYFLARSSSANSNDEETVSSSFSAAHSTNSLRKRERLATDSPSLPPPEELAMMSRSERKRHRERKRRSDVNKGFEKLISLLGEIDPSCIKPEDAADSSSSRQQKSQPNQSSTSGHQKTTKPQSGGGGTSSEGESGMGGRILGGGGGASSCGVTTLKRAALIERAVSVLERVHRENEARKVEIEELRWRLEASENLNLQVMATLPVIPESGRTFASSSGPRPPSSNRSRPAGTSANLPRQAVPWTSAGYVPPNQAAEAVPASGMEYYLRNALSAAPLDRFLAREAQGLHRLHAASLLHASSLHELAHTNDAAQLLVGNLNLPSRSAASHNIPSVERYHYLPRTRIPPSSSDADFMHGSTRSARQGPGPGPRDDPNASPRNRTPPR